MSIRIQQESGKRNIKESGFSIERVGRGYSPPRWKRGGRDGMDGWDGNCNNTTQQLIKNFLTI